MLCEYRRVRSTAFPDEVKVCAIIVVLRTEKEAMNRVLGERVTDPLSWRSRRRHGISGSGGCPAFL